MGIILVYDITNNKTFENVNNWILDIQEVLKQQRIIFLADADNNICNCIIACHSRSGKDFSWK